MKVAGNRVAQVFACALQLLPIQILHESDSLDGRAIIYKGYNSPYECHRLLHRICGYPDCAVLVYCTWVSVWLSLDGEIQCVLLCSIGLVVNRVCKHVLL